MQKLDFTENLHLLRKLLKCDEIVKFVDGLPNNSAVNTSPLTPMIIESKSNYDKIEQDDQKSKILKTIGADSIYSEESIGSLINSLVQVSIQKQQKIHVFLKPGLLEYYKFHFTIIQATELSEKVLFQEKISEIINEDTIVFRVLTDDGLEIQKYSKILSLLSEIIEVISSVSDEEIIQPTITLLDSGSDTNLGVKTTVETTKSLFQIFKEVWDWVLNRKFYKSKLRNSALLENLEVMSAIKVANDNGVIDDDTAKVYQEKILRRTEDLLELNVVPKELLELGEEVDSKKLLAEFSETKLLEQGNMED